MATLILKSLGAGYALTLLGLAIIMGIDKIEFILLGPTLFWPATLIVSGLAFLVFLAIEENK